MSETLSVTMSETSRVVKRDLAVMKITGIIRHEGSDKTGVGVISISLSATITVVKGQVEMCI